MPQMLSKPGALKYGLMAVNTKVNGLMAKLMVKVNFGMQTVIATKENGQMTKPMDMACICTLMEHDTSAHGKTTFNTVRARRLGSMAARSKAIMSMDKKRDVAPIFGSMGPASAAAGTKTKLMVMVFINGPTVVNLKAPGKTIICMGRVFILGLTVAATKVTTKMTKSMVTACTRGATGDSTVANGKTANNTGKESTDTQTGTARPESGMKANGRCGWTKNDASNFYELIYFKIKFQQI
jgi:hypothetical protein